jgi:integrase
LPKQHIPNLKTRDRPKPYELYIVDPEHPKGGYSKSFATKDEAAEFWAEVTYTKNTGSYISPTHGRVLLLDRYEAWWATTVLTMNENSRTTIADFARIYVIPRFGAAAIADISREDIESWLAAMVESGYSAETIRKAHRILSDILSHCIDHRLLSINPALNLKLPKVRRKRLNVLDMTQRAALAAAMPERNRLWYITSVEAGTRPEETIALRKRSIGKRRPELLITETLVTTPSKGLVWGPPKTDAGLRDVEIPRFLWEMLLDHAADLDPDDVLFTAARGGPIRLPNFRKRVWYPAAIEAGLGRFVTCPGKANGCEHCKPGAAPDTVVKGGHWVGADIYDLRHTAITDWVKRGTELDLVSQRAGHTSVAFTMDRYVHSDKDDPTMDSRDVEGRALYGVGPSTAGRRLRAIS